MMMLCMMPPPLAMVLRLPLVAGLCGARADGRDARSGELLALPAAACQEARFQAVASVI